MWKYHKRQDVVIRVCLLLLNYVKCDTLRFVFVFKRTLKLIRMPKTTWTMAWVRSPLVGPVDFLAE